MAPALQAKLLRVLQEKEASIAYRGRDGGADRHTRVANRHTSRESALRETLAGLPPRLDAQQGDTRRAGRSPMTPDFLPITRAALGYARCHTSTRARRNHPARFSPVKEFT
jgi:hypothetical protein